MFNLEFVCFRGINIIFKKITVDLLILSLIIACFLVVSMWIDEVLYGYFPLLSMPLRVFF